MSSISNKRRLTSGISVIAIAAARWALRHQRWRSQNFRPFRVTSPERPLARRLSPSTTILASERSGRASTRRAIRHPRSWTVNLHHHGPGPCAARNSTTVQVRQTVTVDFVETQAPTAGGAIVVTGRRRPSTCARPRQSLRTSSPAQIENLPQNRRNFLSFAALAPGVRSPPAGRHRLRPAPSARQTWNVLLDGVASRTRSTTAACSVRISGVGNSFPQIAIQE